jgi:hypothetical protein
MQTLVDNVINGEYEVDNLQHCDVIASALLSLLEVAPEQEAQLDAALLPPQPA